MLNNCVCVCAGRNSAPRRALTLQRKCTSRTSTVWVPYVSCTSGSYPILCSPMSYMANSLWVHSNHIYSFAPVENKILWGFEDVWQQIHLKFMLYEQLSVTGRMAAPTLVVVSEQNLFPGEHRSITRRQLTINKEHTVFHNYTKHQFSLCMVYYYYY